jgi:prolyl-tRNA synthetase
MRQSLLFTKTRKEAPKDEVSKNADLLIRAGYIYKEMAGVYSMLPLGLRVMNNICSIIREEMNQIGGQEVELTSLQDKSVWEKSGRWSDAVIDNWFKTTLKNDTEVGLAFTHEEALTQLMKGYISSYRDVPKYVYQIQKKFRNESRAKSGIMRGREFLMKDLYSFSPDIESHNLFYAQAQIAYTKIFERVGLGEITYLTSASGGSFSKFSHEYQTVTDAGEDIIYIDEKAKTAVNKEILEDATGLVEKKSVEVGNIFTLGTRYSEPFELTYTDAEGNTKPVIMGSYGIGIGRLMGTVAEVLSDDKGLVWPDSIAPFKVHLVALSREDGKVVEYADTLYGELTGAGIEVLYDDRDMRPGEKFADADLIGIPYRIVVSEKLYKENKLELKMRKTGETAILPYDEIREKIKVLVV